MWQVLLAAAAAGSGFFASRFLNHPYPPESESKPDPSEDQQNFTTPLKKQSQASSTALVDCDGTVFRFSSPGSRSGSGSKNLRRKKTGKGGNAEGAKSAGSEKKSDGKCGGLNCSGSARKFAVCVKKRRTSRSAPGKCVSCSSKG